MGEGAGRSEPTGPTPPLRLRKSEDRLLLGDWELFHGPSATLIDTLDDLVVAKAKTLVLTVNAAHLRYLDDSRRFREVYDAAGLRLIDSEPMVFLARLVGVRAFRNTGADLLPLAASSAARKKWRIVIAGGEGDVASRAADILKERHPGADILGMPLPFGEVDSPEHDGALATLKGLDPDIVFVCMGTPKQEYWELHHFASLPEAVYVSAGAAPAFVTRDATRAPVALQHLGFEWFWRFLHEPRRLGGRYWESAKSLVRLWRASRAEN